jgi:hypothetical protein
MVDKVPFLKELCKVIKAQTLAMKPLFIHQYWSDESTCLCYCETAACRPLDCSGLFEQFSEHFAVSCVIVCLHFLHATERVPQ